MASQIKMLLVGMAWLITMAILAFLTYLGAVFQKAINDTLMKFYITNTIFQHEVGVNWWIPAIYYGTILIVAIAITWRCYQEVVADVTYYPEYPY